MKLCSLADLYQLELLHTIVEHTSNETNLEKEVHQFTFNCTFIWRIIFQKKKNILTTFITEKNNVA